MKPLINQHNLLDVQRHTTITLWLTVSEHYRKQIQNVMETMPHPYLILRHEKKQQHTNACSLFS